MDGCWSDVLMRSGEATCMDEISENNAISVHIVLELNTYQLNSTAFVYSKAEIKLWNDLNKTASSI